jgi:hypothetical protein
MGIFGRGGIGGDNGGINSVGGGRSSSASHFSKDYDQLTAGIASDTFWGVELSSLAFEDIPIWQYVVVIAVGIGIPYVVPWYCHGFDFPQETQRTVMVSTMTLLTFIVLFGLGGILWIMPESTVIPVVSTIIYTRTSYPYPIVISHCLSASASYRKNHEVKNNHQEVTESNDDDDDKQQQQQPSSFSYLHSLLGTFFLYGFGGSIVSDLLMGLPVTALSHPRIIPCYLVSWILVWWSPFDVVYGYICGGRRNTINNVEDDNDNNNNKSLFYYLLVAGEAVDAVTTPMGRISRSARELQNKITAPIMAGLFAGIGGATLRFIASEPSSPGGTFQSALEVGFWKTISYSILWWTLAVLPCLPESSPSSNGETNWLESLLNHFKLTSDEERTTNHCDAYNGSDTIRVIIVTCHMIWTLFVDVGVVEGHPLVWLSRNVFLRITYTVSQILRMAQPPSTTHPSSSTNLDSNPDHPNNDDRIESKKKQ